MTAVFFGAFCVYGLLHAVGKPPQVVAVKHNQFFGPFLAGYVVWMLGPVERVMVGRVSPNFITAMSLLMCIATGVAAGMHHLGTAVWLFVFAGIFDIMDGRIARLAGMQTKSGALFDSVSDRWGELVAFGGYAWYLHDSPWMLSVFAALGASTMVSYTRARAEGLGIELSGGMMQRAERMVLVAGGTLVAAWYGANPESASAAMPILGVTMLVCAVTATATALNRWLVAYRQLAAREAAAIEAATPEPAELPVPVPARISALSSPDLRKVRPLEQH
ncbi:MAG TPA: CDP-alcohol phosphatidyltransferase family protein [Kofleriaceae bacterium]|nr:CDP-alcohol phosphatidyltransferase family protein [Kofleriaceae bacterium]